MKKLIFAIAVFISLNATAQTPYTYSPDAGHANSWVLNGIITKYILQNDNNFNSWYQANEKGYKVDTATVVAMEAQKGKVKYIVFGGTWCDDSHNILPKFFTLQSKAGVSDSDISFFGVDRKKHVLGNVSSAFGVTNVPTIIVMKDGKEVGRVVEYGKTGRWDRELGEMLKK